ncbi:MAG: agmatine deiminase [Bifidobacteriaceae bacterium]|jgi:agmatine deiminase|nr:agmatine deiminase [Bifidobacteriaceae bacterium]
MSITHTTTPAADGFHMPAEWAAQAGCWMIWPERPDNWRLGGKPAQEVFAQVASAIAEYEPVTMLVSAGQFQNARSHLPETVRVIEMSNDDSWMRDVGPTFVVDPAGRKRGVDWIFNAWGGLVDGLYFPWDKDDAIAQKTLEIEGVDRYRAPLVLEGGSIDVDGEGTVIVTEECLLSEGRNPDLTREQIEQHLKDYLGVSVVIWLPYGVYLDETNGHTDNFCRFVAPGKVMLTWTDDVSDPQYERSAAALRILESAVDAQGRHLEVVKIHQPGPIFITAEESAGVDAVDGTLPRQEGDRLAGSYVNSYIGNDVVILPLFDDVHDDAAVLAYKDMFPGRAIVTVPGREILLGGGNVHCITQQQPA